MTIIRYLMEHAIDDVCSGNQSELARRLGMDYQVFKGFRNRIRNGGESGLLSESILEMYWREKISVDNVLKAYTRTYMGADIEDAERMYGALFETACSAIEVVHLEAKDVSHVMISAHKLAEQMEKYFCQDLCRKDRYYETDCPMRSYSIFLQWFGEEVMKSCNDLPIQCEKSS